MLAAASRKEESGKRKKYDARSAGLKKNRTYVDRQAAGQGWTGQEKTKKAAQRKNQTKIWGGWRHQRQLSHPPYLLKEKGVKLVQGNNTTEQAAKKGM